LLKQQVAEPTSLNKLPGVFILGFLLTLAVLLLGGLLGVLNARRLAYRNEQVVHTYNVIGELETLLSSLKDAETGQRGYLLTEDSSYLEPYNAALVQVQTELTRLRDLIPDNPEQQTRLDALEPKIAARLNVAKQTIELARAGNLAAALELVRSDTGETLMDDIRQDVAVMQQAERDLLAQRSEVSRTSYRTTVLSLLLSALIGIALVVLVFYLSQRNLKQQREATEVVAKQGERLRVTLASIGDAVITTDTEGRITNLNAVAESLTGWKNHEAQGQPLTSVFHIVNEETRLPVENPALRALQEGIIMGLANHTVLIAKDGTEYPIDDSAAPIRLMDGDIVGCVLVFRDITERHRTERELRYAASVLGSVSEAVIATDLAGHIQSWNKGAENLYGYSHTEVMGKDIGEVIPSHYLNDTENTRAKEDLIAQGTWRGEVMQYHRDGTTRYIGASVTLQHDTVGKPVGMVAANRDITQRKLAEQDLQNSEARFRAVQQTTPDGYMIFESVRDGAGTITDFRWLYANPATRDLVRRDPDTLLGKTLLVEMPGNREEGLFDAYVRVVETGTPWQREFGYQHEGINKWFRSTAAKTGDGFAVSFADISKSKTLETELRNSETFNRTVLESSPDCVKVLDLQGNIVFTNENGLCLLEFDSFSEVRGCAWWDLWPEAQRGELQTLVDKALKGETSHYQGFAPTAKDTPKWWDVIVSPVKSDTGGVTQVLVVSRDITESQKLESDIRDNEERYRSLVQASSQLVWSTNAEGFNSEPQGSWLEFTGQRWEDEQGWGWLNSLHEDDRKRVRASWSRAIETKTMYVERERLRRHDGLYRHMDVRAVPVFAKDGSVREWVGTHTDVTERVTSNEALSESEERYRTLVMASNQAVFTADKTGNHSTGAEAVWSSLSGQSPDEAKGRSDAWLEAVHPDDRASVETIWREAIRERKGYDFSYKTIGKGNKRRHVAVRAVPRFSARGEFLEWIGSITDITQRRQLELDNAFLADISETLRGATDSETLLPTVSKTICQYLELPDCFFVELDEPHERYKVHAGYFSNAPFESREEPLSLYNPVTLREGKAGRSTVVLSTATDERFRDWYEDHFKPVKLEAFVNVPFLRNGELVGSFTVSSNEPYVWTDRELHLIQTVTERTWLTLEKLRVEKELAEKAGTLRRQADLLALANEAVIIRDPHSIISSWNDAATELYGYTPNEATGRNSHELLQTRFIRSTQESVWQTLLAEGFWQGEHEHTTKGGHKLVVLTRQALRRDEDGNPLEIIEVNWDITSRKQVEIQREKLLELTQRSEREALALAEIASSFSLAKPFETNLTMIAQRLAQTVGADACAIEIYEDDKKELGLTGAYGYPAGFAEALLDIRKNGLETLAQQAIRQGEVIIAKEFVKTTLANKDYAPLHDLMREQAWGTVVAVPLPVTRYAGGAVVVFYPHGLDPDLTDLLQLSTIVSQIALVVENARLFEEAQGKAALEERQRLARDLHDSVSQALYGISLGANSAKTALGLDSSEAKLREFERSLEYLIYMADTAMAEMKSLIFELRPESLATEGLVMALRKHLRALELRHRFALQLDLPSEPDVSLEVKEMLYRITQEAMNNIVKHAQANHVWIRLSVSKERLELDVRDDGHGFDPNREFPGHLGLRSMRERAEKLGATYEISSKPNQGTTVHVVLPLH
jgi:PAS domain S-box-containing protein